MILQHVKNPFAIRSLMLIILGAALFSFTRIGGDSFTIYLDDKVLLKEHVLPNASVKNISIGTANVDKVLKVYYSHCGKTGVQRAMAIRDNQEQVLKSWSFSDEREMYVPVKELAEISGKGLKLVYSSREIPEGKVLAVITLSGDLKASLK